MSITIRNLARQYITWHPLPAAASIGIALAVSIAAAAVLLVSVVGSGVVGSGWVLRTESDIG